MSLRYLIAVLIDRYGDFFFGQRELSGSRPPPQAEDSGILI